MLFLKVRCFFVGTLWNLSSHDSVKMEIVDHALHALSDEVLVPHSGWERGSNGAGGGEENCKPRHLEWETALTNTAGCLRYGRTRGWCVGRKRERSSRVAFYFFINQMMEHSAHKVSSSVWTNHWCFLVMDAMHVRSHSSDEQPITSASSLET